MLCSAPESVYVKGYPYFTPESLYDQAFHIVPFISLPLMSLCVCTLFFVPFQAGSLSHVVPRIAALLGRTAHARSTMMTPDTSLALIQDGAGTRGTLRRMRVRVISAATAAPILKKPENFFFSLRLLLCWNSTGISPRVCRCSPFPLPMPYYVFCLFIF